MLSKITLLVAGIILLGATAALAEPPDDFGNKYIEMAVEFGMEPAAAYFPTKADPSAFTDDSPALYMPASASPSLFTWEVDQANENPLHEW